VGNRKERVRDYASSPDQNPSSGFGRQPNIPKREAQKTRIEKEPKATISILKKRLYIFSLLFFALRAQDTSGLPP